MMAVTDRVEPLGPTRRGYDALCRNSGGSLSGLLITRALKLAGGCANEFTEPLTNCSVPQ